MSAQKLHPVNKKHAGNLTLLGGRLCLDFVNTVEWWGKKVPHDYLATYNDLLAWGRHAHILTSKEAKTLSQKAAERRSEAKKILTRGLELRENIYRLFSAIAAGKKPAKKTLMRFNKHLAATMRSARIWEDQGCFRWDATGDKKKLDWILNPIIYSTAELLVSDELKKVKSCYNPFCGWLFLDRSRNQSRRWCDMKDCGNRAKATRFYNKKQKHKGPSGGGT